jgi:hypothetical protein
MLKLLPFEEDNAVYFYQFIIEASAILGNLLHILQFSLGSNIHYFSVFGMEKAQRLWGLCANSVITYLHQE